MFITYCSYCGICIHVTPPDLQRAHGVPVADEAVRRGGQPRLLRQRGCMFTCSRFEACYTYLNILITYKYANIGSERNLSKCSNTTSDMTMGCVKHKFMIKIPMTRQYPDNH